MVGHDRSSSTSTLRSRLGSAGRQERNALSLPLVRGVFLAAVAFLPSVLATRHTFTTNQDARFLIGPIGIPYGFLTGGVYNMTVFDFSITAGPKRSEKSKKKSPPLEESDKSVEAGFLLKRFESQSEFARHWEEIMEDPSLCSYEAFRTKADTGSDADDPLGHTDDDAVTGEAIFSSDDAAGDGVFLSVRDRSRTWSPNTPNVEHTFTAGEEGLYFLIYQICTRGNATFTEIRSTFELDLAYHNYDQLGNISYLTAGEMPLPHMFLYFSVSYALLLGIWISNIRGIQSGRDDTSSGRPVVLPIHHLMTALLILKFFTIFLEAIRYHYIRISGHANAWSVVYYTFAFLKGTFLFTVILLIGSGWSFVKPFLTGREKKVIFLVLLLQVVDNIAMLVLTHETEGERLYDDWAAILHLVDIVCCCAVLIPIVWSVNALEKNTESEDETLREDGDNTSAPSNESQKTLAKLKLFRSFYLLVVAYIYFTRVVVFLFATMLGYRHTWLRYFVTELGTLSFYVVVGIKFRPMVENPYFAVKKGDLDDESGNSPLHGGVEMRNVGDKV
uniref:GOST seven transmembrane domain-containing protein n=1 Tax=Odontella aurita TaxID=265563 RepID=A0A7S4J8H5_9STRA|mmetsp:Transcript_41349/g.125149  ORF Transcript_41349/g.125149 Transcript_41349/m.125149 type:complete len:559 (+) Transcript_41349:287-1963(+)